MGQRERGKLSEGKGEEGGDLASCLCGGGNGWYGCMSLSRDFVQTSVVCFCDLLCDNCIACTTRKTRM